MYHKACSSTIVCINAAPGNFFAACAPIVAGRLSQNSLVKCWPFQLELIFFFNSPIVMAFSQNSRPLGMCVLPEKNPGPLCVYNGQPYRDTPGALGVGDWAEYSSGSNFCPILNYTPVSCACDRDITIDELCWIYPHQKRKKCEAYLPLLNNTFRNYNINTCLRKAHFLAQVGHESGELQYTAEGLAKGHTESKDYGGYKGRGLIQLTFKNNYTNYGAAVKLDFLDENRLDLEKPEWATDSAGWYWTSGVPNHDLNLLADKNDLLAITAFINGAFNGFSDRRKYLATAFSALKVGLCPNTNVGTEAFRKFKESECASHSLQAFAWGAWNDIKTAKAGVNPKNAEDRKEGYSRYLELKGPLEKKPTETPDHRIPTGHPHKPTPRPHQVPSKPKKTARHFGYTEDQMDSLAQDGSK